MHPQKLAKAVHKLGDDRRETAKHARILDPNFRQSRDVHEDRGTMQAKMGRPRARITPRRGK